MTIKNLLLLDLQLGRAANQFYNWYKHRHDITTEDKTANTIISAYKKSPQIQTHNLDEKTKASTKAASVELLGMNPLKTANAEEIDDHLTLATFSDLCSEFKRFFELAGKCENMFTAA